MPSLLTIQTVYLKATEACSNMTGQKNSDYKRRTDRNQTARILKKTKQKELQPLLQINVHIEICVYSGNGDCLAFGVSLKWRGLQSLKTLFSQSVSQCFYCNN